tara:strand:+ start:943 stop:1677 length:735 start_codon:yes stop_codon:yes gene_type:complete
MKNKSKFLLLVVVSIILLSFTAAHRHKIQVLFKKEKTVFQQLTTNGIPNLKECYILRGEILGVRQNVAHFSLKDIDDNHKKAFYINAYNLAVLAELNEYYPIQSIEDAPDFFKSKDFMVAKKHYNLQSLRNYIIDSFHDPRIHFALYLGGISSPTIPSNAFYHEQINETLNKITTRFINDLTRVKIKTRSKMVLLPEFMLWNKENFNVKDDQAFLAYINTYRSKEKQIPKDYTIGYYPYSWKLN